MYVFSGAFMYFHVRPQELIARESSAFFLSRKRQRDSIALVDDYSMEQQQKCRLRFHGLRDRLRSLGLALHCLPALHGLH